MCVCVCVCVCVRASGYCLVEKFPITCLSPLLPWPGLIIVSVPVHCCRCVVSNWDKTLFRTGKNLTNFVFEWNSKNYIYFFALLYWMRITNRLRGARVGVYLCSQRPVNQRPNQGL